MAEASGKADPRIRARVFAFLRQSGFDPGRANRLALKLVGALARPGPLPPSAVTLAGGALGSPPRGEDLAPRLLDPKLAAYETTSSSASGSYVKGMRSDEVVIYGGHARYGTGPDFDGGKEGADFVLLAPLPSRPEVRRNLGIYLDHKTVQALAEDVEGTL
jgi:hypothetical protein